MDLRNHHVLGLLWLSHWSVSGSATDRIPNCFLNSKSIEHRKECHRTKSAASNGVIQEDLWEKLARQFGKRRAGCPSFVFHPPVSALCSTFRLTASLQLSHWALYRITQTLKTFGNSEYNYIIAIFHNLLHIKPYFTDWMKNERATGPAVIPNCRASFPKVILDW